MHPFAICGGVLHATALAVLGFFVLFAADRAAGRVRTLGNALGVWLLILAMLLLICAIVIGNRPRPWGGQWMGAYHNQMMGYGPPGWRQSAPTAATENQTAPVSATSENQAAPATK